MVLSDCTMSENFLIVHYANFSKITHLRMVYNIETMQREDKINFNP